MTSIKFIFDIEPKTIYCFSDLHIDAPSHDRERMMDDLEEAKSRNAVIFIGGDIWSAIFPSDKKRYTSAHAISQIDALIDYAVNRAFDLLKPYADNIYLLCTGNHETSVIKYHHTDPTNRLREKLQAVRNEKLPHIRHGGYAGFISLNFRPKSKANHSVTENWFFHHGKGTNAPVTKGAIDLHRVRAGNFADVYWLGHKHTNISDIPAVRFVDSHGNIKQKEILSFFTAGYEGKMQVREYEKDGYILDYPTENFYISQSQGCAKISYRLKDDKGILKIHKTMEKTVQ